MLVRIGCSSWRRQHKDRPISGQALALPAGRVAGVFLLVTIMECVFDVDQSAISNLLVWDVAQSGGDVDIANFDHYIGDVNIPVD